MAVTGIPIAVSHHFIASTVGRKVVMAVTGLMLFGFVLVHLVGNLQLYLGPDAINAYGRFLREVLHGAGIWIARAVLLTAVVLHMWAATMLTLESWSARPQGYRRWQARESTYASRTMRWGGVILAAFIVFHLLHFTLGSAHPDFREGDVYHNVVAGFQVVPVSVFYMVAMVLLGLHLYHGAWSMLQTLGLSHPRYKRLARAAAAAFAVLVALGNISFPIAVLAGLVR